VGTNKLTVLINPFPLILEVRRIGESFGDVDAKYQHFLTAALAQGQALIRFSQGSQSRLGATGLHPYNLQWYLVHLHSRMDIRGSNLPSRR
jgi:hypothetical protein